MMLLAETATGLVVTMSIPDNRVQVTKSLKVDFVRRAKGDLTAEAVLTPADLTRIETEDRGEIRVPVVVRDETGNEPMIIDTVWAWTPQRAK